MTRLLHVGKDAIDPSARVQCTVDVKCLPHWSVKDAQ